MLDAYQREITYLRLSVTELCNLRCRYCMPAEGIKKCRHGDMMTEEETVLAVRAAASLGINKLRVTGGEPLVKKNILSLVTNCAAVPGIREVALTTNGTLLPPLAKPLLEAGVKRVNLSLDTLDPEKYVHITRTGSLAEALKGLECALETGFSRVKINAVLIGGFNDDEIGALAALTEKYPVDMRFIELMPMVEGLPANAFLPCETVLEKLPELTPVPGDGGVAELYRLPGALGNIGLIRPVSRSFCASCSRLRLTADGKVKPCLHSKEEFSLKGLDLEGMKEVLKRAILSKPAAHAPLSGDCMSEAGRLMHEIGG